MKGHKQPVIYEGIVTRPGQDSDLQRCLPGRMWWYLEYGHLHDRSFKTGRNPVAGPEFSMLYCDGGTGKTAPGVSVFYDITGMNSGITL